MRIDPSPGRQNCRTEVRCGAAVLYGDRASNGFNACEIAGGAVVLPGAFLSGARTERWGFVGTAWTF